MRWCLFVNEPTSYHVGDSLYCSLICYQDHRSYWLYDQSIQYSFPSAVALSNKGRWALAMVAQYSLIYLRHVRHEDILSPASQRSDAVSSWTAHIFSPVGVPHCTIITHIVFTFLLFLYHFLNFRRSQISAIGSDKLS